MTPLARITRIVEQLSTTDGIELALATASFEHSRTAMLGRFRSAHGELCLKVRRDAAFESESLFYTAVLGSGGPVPKVHAWGAVEQDHYLLMDWLVGDASVADEMELGRAIGAALHGVHEVRVEGVGRVRRGNWEAASWSDFLQNNLNRFFRPRLAELPIPRDLLVALEGRLALLVEQCRGEPLGPRLLHSDLGMDNVVWRGGTLLGFVDPGWCIGGDPLLDVSYFRESAGARLFRGFAAGYPDYDRLDRSRLDSYAVYHRTAKLMHWIDEGRSDRIERGKARLVEALEA